MSCRLLISSLTVALSVHAGIAKSESLCQGLTRALQDSEAGYVSLRGKFDFDLGEYAANVTFGDAASCITESGDGVSSVKCTQRFQSETEAQAAFKTFATDTPRCFRQGALNRTYNQPASVAFKHLETSDDIRIRSAVLQPRKRRPQAIYYVSIEITHIDRNGP